MKSTAPARRSKKRPRKRMKGCTVEITEKTVSRLLPSSATNSSDLRRFSDRSVASQRSRV